MSFTDMPQLRERTPEGIEVVRDIISTVETTLAERNIHHSSLGRISMHLGQDVQLEVKSAIWQQRVALDAPCIPHRVMTIRTAEHQIAEQSERGIVYDVMQIEPLTVPIVFAHETNDAPKNIPNCSFVQVAGASEQRPLLFDDGELRDLAPTFILRRLELFKSLVGLAVRDTPVRAPRSQPYGLWDVILDDKITLR